MSTNASKETPAAEEPDAKTSKRLSVAQLRKLLAEAKTPARRIMLEKQIRAAQRSR